MARHVSAMAGAPGEAFKVHLTAGRRLLHAKRAQHTDRKVYNGSNGAAEHPHRGLTPNSARKRSKRTSEMTLWHPSRVQHIAKPLYSARGPSLRRSMASECSEPVRARDLSCMIRTLITSTG